MKIKSGLYHVEKIINNKYYIAEVIWIDNKLTVRIIYPRVLPEYDKVRMSMKNFQERFEFIERINLYNKV